MRKSSRDFAAEVKSRTEVYELDLANPPEGHCGFVTFTDPGEIDTKSAWSLQETGNPTVLARAILSAEDYRLWWAEWQHYKATKTTALLEDVRAFYGNDQGKGDS